MKRSRWKATKENIEIETQPTSTELTQTANPKGANASKCLESLEIVVETIINNN